MFAENKTRVLLNLLMIAAAILLPLLIAGRMESHKPVEDTAQLKPLNVKTEETVLAAPEKAPDFTFTDLDGKSYSFSDLKGKAVLLNFWASWCMPCIHEFPALLELAEEYEDRLVLLAVSSDQTEEAIHGFIGKLPERQQEILKQQNIFIAQDADMKITHGLFNTLRLPETIIIDPEQMMIHKIAGAGWETGDIRLLIDGMAF